MAFGSKPIVINFWLVIGAHLCKTIENFVCPLHWQPLVSVGWQYNKSN
jgi:hypothetical protein